VRLTGGQIVAQALKSYDVEYVSGRPGDGIGSQVDAFLEEGSDIQFIQVMHEQSAAHLADGYARRFSPPRDDGLAGAR
jgi:acetolactate synthase-1/2/3 large subunit